MNPAGWRNTMVRIWTLITIKILGLKVNIKGTPPDPPFFLVSNHLSYIDIISFFSVVNGVFIAKSQVESWPFIGRMARSIHIIFIDRETKRDIPRVNRLIASNITGYQGVILFPEGTSTNGEHVKDFKSSLLQYAADEKFPVSYATITYRTHERDKPAHEWVCWWGDMTFPDHFFNLLKLKSFEATVTFGEQKVRGTNRKMLGDTLHQLVKHQFTPTKKY